MSFEGAATPDLLGHLAEVSHLQLQRRASGAETVSTTDPSPVASSLSENSPDFINLDGASSVAARQNGQVTNGHQEYFRPVAGRAGRDQRGGGAPKITRQRQQVSCAECHRRKQSCNRQTPCSRCVDRGIADQCRVANKGSNRVHRDPSPPGLAQTGLFQASKKRKTSPQQSSVLPAFASGSEDDNASSDIHNIGQLVQAPHANGDRQSMVYHGPSSLLDILSRSFPETKNPAPTNAMSMVQSTWGGLSAATGVGTITLSIWLAKLPNRIVCDRLVEEFFTSSTFLHWHFSSSHKSSFMSKYRLLWSCQHAAINGADEKAPVSLSFFALTCLMMATSLLFLPHDLGYLTEDRPDEIRHSIYSVGRQALAQSEVEDPPDIYRVEALLMDGVYSKYDGRPNDIYANLALAIRIAQGLGMHREAPASWNIKPLEDQLRKRLWASLYAYDRTSAIYFGRPYVIQDDHCDVSPPANVDDCDLTEDGPRNIQSENNVTDVTYLLLQLKIARIVGRMFDACLSISTPTYQKVLDLDQELHQLELRIPAGFKSPTPNELHRRPYLRFAFGLTLALICRIREQLHRPYLVPVNSPNNADRFALSRTAVVTLARRVLACLRDICAHINPKYFIPWAAYESGATLCIAALLEKRRHPFEETPDFCLIDESVKDSIYLLEHSTQGDSACVKMTGIKTLRNAYLNEGVSKGASKPAAPAAAAATSVTPDPSALGDTGQIDLDLQNAWMFAPDTLQIDPNVFEPDFLTATTDFSAWDTFQRGITGNMMAPPMPPLF